MNEWKGRWKCEECDKQGSSIWRQLVIERGWHYFDEEKRCTGRIVPYERRAPDPEVVGHLEARAQKAEAERDHERRSRKWALKQARLYHDCSEYFAAERDESKAAWRVATEGWDRSDKRWRQAESERDALKAEVARWRDIKAEFDDDEGLVYSLASLCDAIDSDLTREYAYRLYTGLKRRAEAAEAERDAHAAELANLLRGNGKALAALAKEQMRVAELEKLIVEWLRTPFYEKKEDWQKWVSGYGPRVKAALRPEEEHPIYPTIDVVEEEK